MTGTIKDDLLFDIETNNLLEEKYTEIRKTINETGKIMFPGLVNTHNHLFKKTLR